jgi:hypothetical protein
MTASINNLNGTLAGVFRRAQDMTTRIKGTPEATMSTAEEGSKTNGTILL